MPKECVDVTFTSDETPGTKASHCYGPRGHDLYPNIPRGCGSRMEPIPSLHSPKRCTKAEVGRTGPNSLSLSLTLIDHFHFEDATGWCFPRQELGIIDDWGFHSMGI